MPELSTNYSEVWGALINPNVCLQAMFFPVSPSFRFQLSSIATSLMVLDEKARLAQASNRGFCRWRGAIRGYSEAHCSFADIIIHVHAETVDEQNQVRETDRGAVETTSPNSPPTHPTVPPDPCEGETISLITAQKEQYHPSVYLHQREEHALWSTSTWVISFWIDIFPYQSLFPWNGTVLQMSSRWSFCHQSLILTSSPYHNLCRVTFCH